MDSKTSHIDQYIKIEDFKELLVRAYLKGENLSNIDTKDFIDELAKHIQRSKRK